MAITRASVHVSNPVEKLYRDLMFGSETINKNVAQIIPGQRKQVTLNRFYSAENKITARVATPTTAADALTKDEKQITMADIMWYDEFDPMEFNVDWKFLNSVGPQVTSSAAAVLLEAIRGSVTTAFNADFENLLWNGDTASGSAWLSPIDGIVKLIDADGTVNSVTPAGAVTAANVISILEDVVQATPAEVRELSNPVIVTTHAIKYAYDEAARALDFKGANIYEAGQARFGGYPIISLDKVPANRIFMMNGGPGDMAEVKVATWIDSDRFNVKIERLQNNSDLFFIKIGTSVGVNHVYGKQITEYSPA